MDPNNKSPLEKLVTSWLQEPPTQRDRLVHLNIQLWRAVADDHVAKSRIGIMTSPTQDPKVKWAVQFLEKMSGERRKTCPHIEASARFSLGLPLQSDDEQDTEETQLSGKAAAANDR